MALAFFPSLGLKFIEYMKDKINTTDRLLLSLAERIRELRIQEYTYKEISEIASDEYPSLNIEPSLLQGKRLCKFSEEKLARTKN